MTERSERSCRADNQVPLRKWAEERAQQGTPIDWGLGHGAPFAITNSSPAKVASDEGKAVEDVVAGMLPAGSHAYRNFQNTEMRDEWFSGAPYHKCVPSPCLLCGHSEGSVRCRRAEPRIVGEGLPLGAAEPEAVQAMRKIMPELSSAEATAAIEAHDGSLREAMRSLLASL